jgi:glycosyltransferase involved in cell wall biosynthesis
MVNAAKAGTPPGRRKVCIITVIPFQINVFLAEHVLAMSAADVVLISGGERSELRRDLLEHADFRRVDIVRPIRPWSDLVALVQIFRIVATHRPDVVQTLAPKAGLLGMIAARLCGVPVRVHWFTGQVWSASRGIKRAVLRSADRLIAGLATDPLVDSPSQRDFLVGEKVAPRAKLSVLGAGSVRGVDESRFRPDAAARALIRSSLGIPADHTALIFVGRITRDKGVSELARAMRALRLELPDLHAILVGFEEGAFARRLIAEAGDAKDRLHIVGYSDAPERFLAAADFMVLPSYREGFGSSVIEAAACGLPAIGTRIVGLVDAIAHGETGILVPPRDAHALANAIRNLTANTEMRARMGAAARQRALRDFRTAALVEALQAHYERALRHSNRQ